MIGSAAKGQKQPRMEGHEARAEREEPDLHVPALHKHFIDVWVGGSVVRLGGLPVKYSYVALFCGKYKILGRLPRGGTSPRSRLPRVAPARSAPRVARV